ncbi:MAG: hypothetical protein IH849_06670 [Acidobacteria bacterium]|nr:hypothetical protein [Acidobacteriota bacterium]
MSKIVDLYSLSAAVPSGATVAIGGFQLNRVPVALLQAIADRGRTDLECVSAPNPLGLQILAAAGCIRAAECGFIGFQYEDGFVIAPAVRRALATGELRLRQPDVYDTIQSLRAAADNGEPRADFALLHAQRADRNGNLQIDDPYVDVELAHASGAVLATAEVVVDEIDAPTIPAGKVELIAVVKNGAAPTSCFGHYPRDAAGVREHIGVTTATAPTPTTPAEGEAGAVALSEASTVAEDEASAADELLVYMARQVNDGEVIVTGLASAVPMLAIELARRTHAPGLTYINCIGAVNPRIDAALPTSVEADLRNRCERTIELPDLFDLARNGGVDAMFFGAGQVDGRGNINLSRIGPADNPKVRFAGPAGSPSMRSYVRRVLITVPHQLPRNLVERVDVVTSAPADRNEETILVTDAAIWRLRSNGFEPASLHAGVTSEDLSGRTGFEFGGELPTVTTPPSESELAALHSIDADGLRYRLLAGKGSSARCLPARAHPTRSRKPEKVMHER